MLKKGGINLYDIKPIFSIIIPIYNAEKHIRFTLESIKSQTFQNYEVLMIDDGSSDNSALICEKYMSEDARFKLIKKENGGVSTARNLGIKHAKGKYVYFMDSDDWIEDTLLETCLNIFNHSNVDIVIFGMSFDIEKNGEITNSLVKTYSEKLLNSQEYKNEFIELYKNNYISSMCNKVIKKDILSTYDIKFDEKITNYEDLLFAIMYINKCSAIKIVSDCFYHYILRDELGMSRKYKKNLSDMIPRIIRRLKNEYKVSDFPERILAYLEVDLQRMLWLGVSNICRASISLKDKENEIKKLCENSLIVDDLIFEKNGNKFNDINLYLLKKKYWMGMIFFNKFINKIRDIKY